MRERTIASHFARAALGGACRRGYDYSELLQTLGISLELLNEPKARIAPEQFASLLQQLWQVLDDEYLGFGDGEQARHLRHDVPRPDPLQQPGEGPAAWPAVLQPVPQAPRLSLTREGDMTRLSLDDAALWDPDHFLSESLLVIWHRLGSWLIGQRIRLEQACFSYPKPEHGNEYDLLFPCPWCFPATAAACCFTAAT